MDLRQLRYFVAVAEELSFSRAAVKLHMSQPPLSHQIKALEQELGVLLLVRNQREVHLTDAGRAFLHDSRALLDQAQMAASRAKQAALGYSGSLRIGMATSAIDRVMPGFLARLREELGSVQVAMMDMGSDEQVRALAQDKLDLGFVHSRVASRSLARMATHAESFSIVLREDHPLANSRSLHLLDLAEEPMITFSREHRSALFDTLVAACMNAGFSPRLVHVARHPSSMFQMIRNGLGVSVVPTSYADAAGAGIIAIALPETDARLQIDAVWRADHRSELLQQVIERVLVPLKD